MTKTSPSDKPAHVAQKLPAGQRSGKGASSVLPYLAEASSTRPAPLEPLAQEEKPPRRRWLWKW